MPLSTSTFRMELDGPVASDFTTRKPSVKGWTFKKSLSPHGSPLSPHKPFFSTAPSVPKYIFM